MKKLFISLCILFVSVITASAQATKEDVVVVSYEQMTASKAAIVGRLTYGKSSGFDEKENGFIVRPADATKETLDNLVKEIKFKSPDCTVKVISVGKKATSPTATEGTKN